MSSKKIFQSVSAVQNENGTNVVIKYEINLTLSKTHVDGYALTEYNGIQDKILLNNITYNQAIEKIRHVSKLIKPSDKLIQ